MVLRMSPDSNQPGQLSMNLLKGKTKAFMSNVKLKLVQIKFIVTDACTKEFFYKFELIYHFVFFQREMYLENY